MNPAMPDPVIDEIREIRHRISVLCNHEPAQLVAYFQKIQEQYPDRLITSPRFARPLEAQPVVPPDADKTAGSRPATPVASPSLTHL